MFWFQTSESPTTSPVCSASQIEWNRMTVLFKLIKVYSGSVDFTHFMKHSGSETHPILHEWSIHTPNITWGWHISSLPVRKGVPQVPQSQQTCFHLLYSLCVGLRLVSVGTYVMHITCTWTQFLHTSWLHSMHQPSILCCTWRKIHSSEYSQCFLRFCLPLPQMLLDFSF